MSRSVAMKVSLALGVVYVLIGVLGFVPGITVANGATAGQGLLLGIFAVNTIHNIAHLVLGAALIWAATTGDNVRLVNKGLAAVFAILVVGSLIAPIVEGVAINPPDTGLHLLSLLVTAAIGFMSLSRARALA
ncbi:MAG TPA: DUF4383 domain-containing protein [Chloroflexota bacterium]|jgi:hypothetical protein